MNWLTSPLAATVVVFAVLASLAIPLRKLTTDRAVSALPTAAGRLVADGDGAGNRISGILRVRLLHPVTSLAVVTTGGDALWQAGALDAGEHEVDAWFPWEDDALEVFVEADFGAVDADTALFLTVLPDGLAGITHYAIGSGRIDELMIFEWNLN